jgi:hypothetical protein
MNCDTIRLSYCGGAKVVRGIEGPAIEGQRNCAGLRTLATHAHGHAARELTSAAWALGALITTAFAAANIYLGLGG